jgi:hypothetical protein
MPRLTGGDLENLHGQPGNLWTPGLGGARLLRRGDGPHQYYEGVTTGEKLGAQPSLSRLAAFRSQLADTA